MSIPDAAIEAAAEGLWQSAQNDRRMHIDLNPKPSWASRGELTKSIWRRDALAALEAAMPAIREALAQTFIDMEATNVAAVSPRRAANIILGATPQPTRCGYCGGSGWAPGCGDQTCCPPGPCASCDGTGTPKDRT